MRRAVAVTAVAPALWGTTYAVTAEFLPPDRPLLAAAVRALPLGIVLTVLGRRVPTGRWWFRAAVLGVCNFGAFFALLFTAAYRLPGGVAATIGATQPILVTALGVALVSERPQRRRVLAAIVGVVGVGMLVLRSSVALDAVGVIAAALGAASMATGTVLVQRWGRPAPLLTFAGWQLAAGGLVLAPLAVAVEGVPASLSTTNLVGYGYLIVIGAGVAYPLWFRGIEWLGAGAATFLSLLSPLTATTIGWLRGERLTAWQVLGVVAVLGSVVAGSAAVRRRPTRVPAPALVPSVATGAKV